MPRCRIVCTSPPCSSSDEERPDSGEAELEDRLAANVATIRAFEATITYNSSWQFESREAVMYRRSGLYEANRSLASEVIDFYVDAMVDRMMEDRVDLGWAPASPAAYRELKSSDQEAFQFLMSSLELVPWLFILRAWDIALQFPRRRDMKRDASPEHEVTVMGIVREILDTSLSQVRNSVYTPQHEPDWE